MKPVDQTILYSETQAGNCMQASVASLLGLPLSEVPHFAESNDPETTWDAFFDFFDEKGYLCHLQEKDKSLDCAYLASGPSNRGVSHMVVMCGGKLLHDPHPSREGIKSVTLTYVIIPKRLC